MDESEIIEIVDIAIESNIDVIRAIDLPPEDYQAVHGAVQALRGILKRIGEIT